MPRSNHLTADGGVTEQFARLMQGLADARPAGRMTERLVRINAVLLGDLSLDEVRHACARAVREMPGAFLPSAADLRRLVTGTDDDAALLAWSALNRIASEAGSYASVMVEDGAAARALLAVWPTWEAFCGEDEGPALAQRRAEFVAHYRRIRRQGVGLEPVKLSGLVESAGGRAVPWVLQASGDVVEPPKALPGRPL